MSPESPWCRGTVLRFVGLEKAARLNFALIATALRDKRHANPNATTPIRIYRAVVIGKIFEANPQGRIAASNNVRRAQ
jgi:hypothetical protein